MRNKTEQEYLLKAIDAFGKRLIVVTSDFEILAASKKLDNNENQNIIGQLCHEVFYGRPTPCENCAVKKSREKGQPYLRLKPEDSQVKEHVPCYYAYPLYSDKGIEAYVSMDFDLPVTRGLEEKVNRSNAFLRNLILSSIDGVIATDKKGMIIIFNSAAAEISGYSIQEALNNMDIRDFYPENLAYEIMKKLRSDEYGGKGKLRSYCIEVINKNRKMIPISLNAAIIYEGDQEVATIGFFHDLREEKKIQKDLKKTQLQLLQSEKMASLGRLAAGVAHQLNNPLGGIILFTSLIMEEEKLDESVNKDLQRIMKDAERCRDTVKELLEFSRQSSQEMIFHNINKALLRTLFLLEGQTLFHNIEIETDFSDSLPPVKVDIQQLNHVFMNIILNAAQAMKGNGKLILHSSFVPNTNNIKIVISDTGPGIPQENLQNIFEPFFTTKEDEEGTGLGLSLAYNIIENHGGKISVSSDMNVGTTFTIVIPVNNQENEGDESGKR